MLNHPSLKSHPTGEVFEYCLVDAVFADALANSLGFLAFVGSLHGQVGHDGIFPVFVNHMTTNMGRYGATGTEPLRANPIGESMTAKSGLHVVLNAVDLIHGLIIGHRCAVRVATTTHHDGEAITSVITKADFLMGSTEDLNFHVREFKFCHLVHGRIDDKELGGHGSLVLGPCEKDPVARNAEFCRKLVAKAICFPICQGDFGHGEATTVIEMDGRGHLFYTEVRYPRLNSATDAVVGSGIPLQADGLSDGVGHGNDLFLQRLAPSNSEATPPMMSFNTFSTPALEVVRM